MIFMAAGIISDHNLLFTLQKLQSSAPMDISFTKGSRNQCIFHREERHSEKYIIAFVLGCLLVFPLQTEI